MSEETQRIIIPATLVGINRRADKTVGFRLNSVLEQSTEQMANSDQFFQQTGVFVFMAKEDATEDFVNALDEIDMDLTEHAKTPSQRLRGVLFKLYEENDRGYPGFKPYYRDRMEAIINNLKNEFLNQR